MFRRPKKDVWPCYLEVGTLTRSETSYDSDGNVSGGSSFTVFVLSCDLCGALVHKADTHNKWHQEMGF